ncbi:competence/damage-inducible protein A [Bacillus sp. FJAT-47783]|uniref:competence/damage-inducible protein A n=1 Tax=Bacillus sp. FJAT-47783 TaxID=2922712 RepID=UPI001FAD8D5C
MNAEIIAVGSELLLGQIANTNAQFISKQLAELGVNVYYHTVVGDNPTRLKDAIETARKRSNIILFTGGLGPTKDDLTKETICSALNRKLVIDEAAMLHIENYFLRTKRHMPENNRKQALVLSGSTVLKNDYGMAPGMALKEDDQLFMLLPGPPKEMEPMFLQYGIPYLKKQLHISEKIISRVLCFFGIGESQLETEIQDLIDAQSNPTIAPLAKDGEVTLRLTAKHHDEEKAKRLIDEVEAEIFSRVGEFFYGYDDATLSKQLMNTLSDCDLTISSAESLTGGLFLEELTKISGASRIVKGGIVCYTNEIKEELLHVQKQTLKTHGAVSEQCAYEMAEQIRTLTNSDIGVSFTGVAGPSKQENKPVGTVFIGISTKEKTVVYPLYLAGSRTGIRNRTVRYGFYYVNKMISSLNTGNE